MARKKSSRKSTATKEFSNSPFKSLKGLSALEEKPAAKKSGAVNTDSPKKTASGDESLFTDEMEFLGVKPLSRGHDQEKEKLPALNPGNPKRRCTESDQELFLDALGSMEKVFKDEWAMDEAPKAVPRRMKQLERGLLKPEDELDLHGMTSGEAAEKLQHFLQRAAYNGFRTVRIITGKGLRSAEGPVLRVVVEQVLNQKRDLVIEWGIAPRRFGGDGAVMVFLRGK